jgi:hypothetical protein
MKKSLLVLSGLAISILLTSCGETSPLTSDSEKAQKYITKACGSSESDLSWQARTNLAAEAYSLDKTWEKFYEATSSLTAVDAVSKNTSEWVNAGGNDGLQMAYLNAKMYSIYRAECTKLVVNE